jgi:membrane-associated phospholipid phosphatase
MKGEAAPWERGAWILAVYALFFVVYGLTNRLVPVESCVDLSLAIDRATPFVPELIFPFWLAYLVIPSPALMLSTRAELARAGLAFGALIIVSGVVFFLVPVTVPRPAAIPDTVAGSLVARVYASDRPVCGFPSLHVSASLVAAFIGYRARAWVGVLLIGVGAVTAVSTLAIKQHGVIDVVGGAILAIVLYRAFWPRPSRGASSCEERRVP